VLRGITQREYDIVDYLPIDIAVQDISDMGLRATSALFYMKDKPEFYAKMNKIIELLNRFGIDIRMVTSRVVRKSILTGGITAVLEVFDRQIDTSVSMPDYGFGTNQLLPIIIQGVISEEGSTIMIEEPEIHLNPRHQTELIDLFIEFIRAGKQLLITTHSDRLFLRLQRRLAEGIIKPEDVRVYYFEIVEGRTYPRIIRLDNRGNPDWWPKGFFEEDFEEAYQRALKIARWGEGKSEDKTHGNSDRYMANGTRFK